MDFKDKDAGRGIGKGIARTFLDKGAKVLRLNSKNMDFKDKVVLITGAARGVGKGIARTFLERGAKVNICDINSELGLQTLQEFEKEFGKNQVIFTKCDVSKDEEFEAAYNECEKSFGALNILINNAGILHKDLKKMREVNFEGTVIGTELAIKRMGKHNGGKGGHVVNISCISGLNPKFIYPYYASTKAAAIHFSRIIGDKFHKRYHGVSIMCLCPGLVRTDMSMGDDGKAAAYNTFVLEATPDFQNISPLEPKDIGEAVVRLIIENKTGEVAVIDNDFSDITPFYYKTFGLIDIGD